MKKTENKLCFNKLHIFGIFGIFLFFLFISFPASADAAALWRTVTSLGDVVASLGKIVLGLPLSLPIAIAVIGLSVIAYIFLGLSILARITLAYVLSDYFTTLSYTNPANNPIIAEGLTITQGLVNMLLFLILVFIAISTILRIGGYQTKRLLVTFIVVALLVNFSPLICGFMVDAANLFMNFFLGTGLSETISGGGQDAVNLFNTIRDRLLVAKNFEIGNLNTLFFGSIEIAVIGLYFLISSLIYSLYAVLFLVRYFAIWILVILSPIAFASYILPATKNIWNFWWNQWVQWLTIGITGAFFLRLAQHFDNMSTSVVPTIVGSGEWYNLGNQLMPLYIPLIFLILGYYFAIQTGAMGAKAVIGKTRTGQGVVGRFAGKASMAAAGRIIGGRGVKFLERQGAAPPPSFRSIGEAKGVLGKVKAAGSLYIAGTGMFVVRRGMGAVGAKISETQGADIKKAEKDLENSSATKKTSIINTPSLSVTGKIAALTRAIEENQMSQLKELGIKDRDIIAIGKQAASRDLASFKAIREAFPKLAKEMGNGLSMKEKRNAKIADFDEDMHVRNDKVNRLQSEINDLNDKIEDPTISEKKREAKNLEKTKIEAEIQDERREIEKIRGNKDKFRSIEGKIIAELSPTAISKLESISSLDTEDARASLHHNWTPEQVKAAARNENLGKEFIEKFERDYQAIINLESDFYEKRNRALHRFLSSNLATQMGLPQIESQRRPQEQEPKIIVP